MPTMPAPLVGLMSLLMGCSRWHISDIFWQVTSALAP